MSHSRQTEHYALPLYNGTDIINPLTDFNNANEVIDETMYEVSQRAVNAEQVAQAASETVAQYGDLIAEKVQVTQDIIAPAFDAEKLNGYDAKEFVIYNDKLYMFTEHHDGAWTGTDAVRKTVYDMFVIVTEV